MMDYMSNDIDSRWVFHTNEESNESNLSGLSMMNRVIRKPKSSFVRSEEQKQL